MAIGLERRHGELLIDHQASPGVPGLPKIFEAKVYTCSHCQRQIIHGPNRKREKTTCYQCFKYICDNCASMAKVVECKTYTALVEEADRLAHKGLIL